MNGSIDPITEAMLATLRNDLQREFDNVSVEATQDEGVNHIVIAVGQRKPPPDEGVN